jgi:hypothetical protein
MTDRPQPGRSPDRPPRSGGPARTPSEEEWLRVHAFLNRNRYELAVRAGAEYPPDTRLAGTPLIAPPAWRLPAPVALDRIRLELRPDAPGPDSPDLAALAPSALPWRPDGTSYQRYSEVVGRLVRPAVFENRPTYRLVEADLAGDAGPRLAFGRGRFFDGIDAGGPAGHEYAAVALGTAAATEPGAAAAAGETSPAGEYGAGGGPFRAALGGPFRAALGGPAGLAARSATLAVSALTLRYDRRAGTASFPLHHRDASLVSHGGGLYQVIPVGVFQPSGEARWNEANDFSLWRGLLREYAEELLGADEDYGSERAPVDYARWPLARTMDAALADGRIRAWCLGLGADPLTFALDLLAVVVIDAPLYDDLFGAAVDANAEGRVLRPRPFDEPSVTELLAGTPLQAAAAALLTLALAHRDTLLG